MPNHVTNILSINNTSYERVQEILEAIKYDDKGIGSVDFEKIIPMPNNIYRGNLGADEFKLYGENNWYDFCTQEWHTKWNSYWHDDNIEYEEGSSTIRFLTAWSAPDTIIKRLSEMFSDVEFEHKWADEDIGSNCGYCIWQNGEVLEAYLSEDGSKEAYKFAAEILEEELSFDKISGYGYTLTVDGKGYEYSSDVFISSDFQSDQTEGCPACLCYDKYNSKVWLELSTGENDVNITGHDISYYQKLCEDWGMRYCDSWGQYNTYVTELGEDAVRSAFHSEQVDEEIEIG
ncbi:MAG: hypothetical protein A2Y17_10505 [Clostridiales bacterium GWF2_38_85]|nr:MAG: hypothetical protein A2Y17_10505 [Clostridiales bacterium GWF2_38_85]